MNRFEKAEARDDILQRLQPLTLWLGPKFQTKVIKCSDTKIISFRRQVMSCLGKCKVLEGTLDFHIVFSGGRVWEMPPFFFQEYFGAPKFVDAKDKLEKFPCVYDAAGLEGESSMKGIVHFHAVMLPPVNGKLGECIAVLQKFSSYADNVERRSFLCNLPNKDIFWANYGRPYQGYWRALNVPEAATNKEITTYSYAHQITPLYIGQECVGAQFFDDQAKRKLISFDEFEKMPQITKI